MINDGPKSPCVASVDPVLAKDLPKMLVVGARQGPSLAPPNGMPDDSLYFATYAEVTPALILRIGPDVVLSTLIGDHFDAIDLAGKLVLANFTDKYRAVTVGLPDPELVRREVLEVAPHIDFDVFQIDGT